MARGGLCHQSQSPEGAADFSQDLAQTPWPGQGQSLDTGSGAHMMAQRPFSQAELTPDAGSGLSLVVLSSLAGVGSGQAAAGH